MGEVIEGLALLFGGIFWLLNTAYEKSTGRQLGILGVLFLLLISAVLCSGAVVVIIHFLFPARP